MQKKLYDAVVSDLETFISNCVLDLLSIEHGAKKLNSGSDEPFTRLELEIPRGNGIYSRCRFSCKLPPTIFNLSAEQLDDGVRVSLTNFHVTYIGGTHEIYSKAEAVQFVQEDEDYDL